jgi:hypothetical protein
LLIEHRVQDVDARRRGEHDGRASFPVYSGSFRPYLNASPSPKAQFRMRPEIQTQLDNAKQSIGLLRRHL